MVAKTLITEWRAHECLIADDFAEICTALKNLIDNEGCALVLTSGGTGPAPRDITPEATRAVSERVIPGFGEEMRRLNLRYVPTAILSRQLAAVRGQALIINLPDNLKPLRKPWTDFRRRAVLFGFNRLARTCNRHRRYRRLSSLIGKAMKTKDFRDYLILRLHIMKRKLASTCKSARAVFWLI